MSTGLTGSIPYVLSEKGNDRPGASPPCGWTASTRRVYASQWAAWEKWAEGQAVAALPADPNAITAYLSQRLRDGAQVSTVRTARAAISAIHRDAGLEDPTTDERVKRVLSGSVRAGARPQRQVTGITRRDLVAITVTARVPRKGPSGRCESQAQADLRGRVDIALISVMRDGFIGRSLAAAVTWADIKWSADGSGLLLIRLANADRTGDGAVVTYFSRATMKALQAVERDDAHPEDLAFGLSPDQVSRRIRGAAEAAGLEGEFSSGSARVGMARDLAASGCERAAMMSVPAARAAVARYYGAAVA